ncbi:MAG: S1 family peptidase [Polyangiales bacterium]
MKNWIGLVASLLALSGCANVEDAGFAESGIVDGTLENGYPEVVFLYNSAVGSACTATIVGPRLVLTAKHCVQNGNSSSAVSASSLRVYVGTSAPSRTSYGVAEVRPAPGRWDLRDASDVAVLILATPASQTPREMSFDSPGTIVGQTFTAVGFGQTPSGGSGTKYSTMKQARQYDGSFIYVEPAVCSGDSGGPIIGPDGRIYGVASFIYSETGGSPRCGTAPGAYNAIARWRTFIEQAIEDSGGCVPTEETCNGVDDNCDGEVDEGCTQTGETCLRDDECVGGLCQAYREGEPARCTLPCNPAQATLGCPADYYCASSGPLGSCDGFCRPGAPGTLPVGSSCTDDTECANARCVDPGNGIKQCLISCVGDGADCLSGEVCAAAPGTCGSCVPPAVFPAARGMGETCGTNEECASGLCLDDAGARYCSRPCGDDAACGNDAFHCRGGQCIRGPREGVGGVCVGNEDCESGICAAGGDRVWCTAFCDDATPCPAGLSCIDAGGSRVCAPDLGIIGEACAANADCTSGICALMGAEGTCTRLCGPDDLCGSGYECVRVDANNAVCLPAATEVEGGGGGGGCATGGGSAPAGMLALLFALGLVSWRRRDR